ncbi:MAG: [protein-PII] uridylyltransferase [Candidatus Nanopelagicales bacterium]|jgi:[protein-PII] uridylyltransferase
MDYPSARSELLSRPGRPTAARRRALVGLTDDWLQGLFAEAGADPQKTALVAVGGYGKGNLAPASDLDLVLLHEPRADVVGVADKIWYPIWDAGMRLDHSVRTVPEARRLAGQDLKVVLGILDVRTIAGSEELTESLRAAVLQDWRALAPRRLSELREVVDYRVERSGELPHLLEPDLKESYGGLRDLTILRAISASWVADAPHQALDVHAEALLDVRDGLHTVTGRHGDKLTLQEQPPVAALLDDLDPDVLLRRVSAAGRAIAYANDEAWYRVGRATASRRSLNPVRRLRSTRPERAPLAEGVVVQDGEAVLAVDARPDRDPVLLLRAAAAAAQAGLRLSPYAVARLASESAPLPEPWPIAARDSLISLLGAGRAAIPVWEALDQADLISRLIPEWKVVRSAPQRNPVHRFTVDRHLVETAVNASSLTREVSRPDLLLVGALLHDIGKGQAGDHTEVGVRIVSELAPRLGFDAQDSAVLVDMVAYHLLLPDTATRRDLADPATAAAVAAAVKTPLVLELLDCLTRADAAATGPAAWSQWKASLVTELVGRTQAALDGRPEPARPALTPSQRELATGEGVQVLIEPGEGVWWVTVAADDRLGLLGQVAGALAVNRLAVRSARTETLGNRAVTVWSVQPEFGEPPTLDLLREDIRLALSGGLDIDSKLHARAAAYRRVGTRRPAPAQFKLVADASDRATVIEVRAQDAPGLLRTIAHAISSVSISIEAAQVATLGSDVVDVFYVLAQGEPLNMAQVTLVRSVVLEALAGSDG